MPSRTCEDCEGTVSSGVTEQLHPGTSLRWPPCGHFPSRAYAHFKRVLDIACAAVALVLLSPVFAACAAAVKLTSDGPVLFKQERWGRSRSTFTCWKFRTMVIETPPDLSAQEFDNKERFMTPVGCFLRRWSLDELPQLANILRGDMSMVGPRPVIVRESRLIDLREPLNGNDVRPGLTGWAQINGRNLVSDEEKAFLDGEYVANMSLAFDAKIFARTVSVVLSRRGIDRREQDGERPHAQLVGDEGRRLITGVRSARPRILFLCEHAAPSVDACSKRVTVFAKHFSERGWDVAVLASETSLADAPKDFEPPFRLSYYPAFAMRKKTVISRLRNNASERFGAVRAARGMGRFDVVVCTSPPLMLSSAGIRIARKAEAKLVFDVRDIWPQVAYEMDSFAPGSVYGRVFSYLAQKAYRAATLVTTVTEGKAATLEQSLQGDLAAKVRIVPNGLDVGFLQNEEDMELVRTHRLDEGPVCAYVGNLGLAQGLSSLLHIAEARPHVRFLLFGSGAEEALLRTAVAERRLGNVSLCGRVDERGAYTVLRRATLAYVPLVSSKLANSVPTKLYEALGCECPVVLAAQGDSVRVLEETGLGAAAPPEDKEALLAAFDAVLERDWTVEERRRASERIVSNHSRQAAAELLENLLAREVLAVREGAAVAHGVRALAGGLTAAEEKAESVVLNG